MLEYFFADGKVKGYDRSDASASPMRSRRFGRIANSTGLDSVMRPSYDSDIASLSFLSNMAFVPFEEKDEPEVMSEGALSDTVQGKYFPKFIYRKSNGLFTVEADALADYKDHHWSPWFFKMLGMTMEMQSARWQLAYRQTDAGRYGIYDFLCGTYNLFVLGKGRLFKKLLGIKDAIGIDCYIEQYPVEIERLTVDEYKVLKKDWLGRREEFRVPANVQPLPPAIERLTARINSEIP